MITSIAIKTGKVTPKPRVTDGVWLWGSPLNNANNWWADATSASGGQTSRFISRTFRPIGSGNAVAARFIIRPWKKSQGGTEHVANDIVIEKMFAEVEELNKTIQLTFNGNTGIVINKNANFVVTDAFYPDQFALDIFSRGLHVYGTAEGTFDGGLFPIRVGSQSQITDKTFVGDQTLTHVNSGKVGAIQSTGTRYNSVLTYGGFALDLQVIYENEPQLSVAGFGDSILAASGDQANTFNGTTVPGYGFFSKALVGQVTRYDDLREGISGCNYSLIGAYAQVLGNTPFNADIAAEIQFANVVLDEYATNNSLENTPTFVNFLRGLVNNGWTGIRNSQTQAGNLPLKLVRTKLMPRTTNPNGLDNLAPVDQPFYGDGWSPTGGVKPFHDFIDSALADGRIDYIFDPAPITRASQDINNDLYYKWPDGGALYTDGTHPRATIVNPMAASLRQLLLTIHT